MYIRIFTHTFKCNNTHTKIYVWKINYYATATLKIYIYNHALIWYICIEYRMKGMCLLSMFRRMHNDHPSFRRIPSGDVWRLVVDLSPSLSHMTVVSEKLTHVSETALFEIKWSCLIYYFQLQSLPISCIMLTGVPKITSMDRRRTSENACTAGSAGSDIKT